MNQGCHMFMNTASIIREATENDIAGIIELENKCFPSEHAYSGKQVKYLIKKANSCCLVEGDGEIIRGVIIILFKRGTKVAGIETLHVDPIFQKKGIARRLIQASETEAKKRCMDQMRLEVSIGNNRAIRIYEQSGYVISGLLKDYYKFDHYGSRDVYRMKKKL